MVDEPIRVGKRGTVVIPAVLRQAYQIEEGTLLIAEPRAEGIMLRPAALVPIEVYTTERKAQFVLESAVTKDDYAWAREQVRKMGVDPASIPHEPPQ